MNVPLSMGEAVSLARQFFREGHRTWARPLVYVLEQSRPQLALRWAIQLYQEFLVQRSQSESGSHHQQWLDGLMKLIDQTDVAERCDRFAYEAWGRATIVDVLDRGVARLYWALKNYLQNLSSDYYFQVTSAVGMLGDRGDASDKMDEATLDRAVALCHRLLEPLDASSRPIHQG
jgi:hypothetical protein